MSAFRELREYGQLGDAGAQLLYETVDAVRRFGGFPPPDGYEHWNSDAVNEVAHDFVAAETGPARLRALVLAADDEESFERLLDTAVRNFLRSRARASDRGAMLRALRRIVTQDDRVVVIEDGQPGAGCWTLLEHADQAVFAGRSPDLIQAAYEVEGVRRARWRIDARHRPPLADAQSLQRVIRAVLERAAAPVLPATVLEVMIARFPFADSPSVALLEDQAFMGDVSENPATRTQAEWVWEQLSDNERLVCGLLDLRVREVELESGLSRGSAHRAMLSAKQVLAELLSDERDQAAVVRELRRLSEEVRHRGTDVIGLASNPIERSPDAT